jgi:dTDP-D-glucose 4,6-dehydratase
VLDNLVYGHADIVQDVLAVPLVQGQLGDRDLIDSVLRGSHPALAKSDLEGRPIEAVLHFAAYAYVGESVRDPAKYYRNNLGDTLSLLEALIAAPAPDSDRLLFYLRHIWHTPTGSDHRGSPPESNQSLRKKQVDGGTTADRLCRRLLSSQCHLPLF